MDFHEAANLFPLMEGQAFADLVSDIKEHGLREDIWTHEGKIIDGRNRYRACKEAHRQPRFRAWNGEGSIIKFVLSLNLHRRHLDESQRAVVSAKIANLEASERKSDRKVSDRSIDLAQPAVSQEEAAAMLNVSVPSLKRAKRVLVHGVPELVRAVEQGEVAVATAATITVLEPELQKQVVAEGPKAISREAKRIKPRPPRKVNGDGIVARTRSAKGRRAPEAIRGAIGTLVGLATGLDSFSVKDAAPTAEEAQQWEKELVLVISAINRFRRQLKELDHV